MTQTPRQPDWDRVCFQFRNHHCQETNALDEIPYRVGVKITAKEFGLKNSTVCFGGMLE